MPMIFEGIKVLELAEWTFVPSAAAILAEFGAEVIKVERPEGGDIQRGLTVAGVSPVKDGVSLQMEASNRGGKRSIGIDLTSEAGRDLVYELAKTADVFMTSLLPKTQKRLGYTAEDIQAVNPKIIFGAGTGLGTKGPEVDRGGYDMTAYWSRGGMAYSLTPPDADRVVEMRPAIGDRLGAMNLVAGIASALFHRERTGEGMVVDVSLLGTAVWQLASDVTYSTALQAEHSRVAKGRNPLAAYYQTADDRWLVLALLESGKWWEPFARHAGMEHLLEDEHFATSESRTEHFEHCRDALAEAFGAQTLEYWRDRLGDFEGPWEPIQSVVELGNDPQVIENNIMRTMTANNGTEVRLVAAPVQFNGEGGRFLPCPEPGANTEEVLMEFGIEWDTIMELKEDGVIT